MREQVKLAIGNRARFLRVNDAGKKTYEWTVFVRAEVRGSTLRMKTAACFSLLLAWYGCSLDAGSGR